MNLNIVMSYFHSFNFEVIRWNFIHRRLLIYIALISSLERDEVPITNKCTYFNFFPKSCYFITREHQFLLQRNICFEIMHRSRKVIRILCSALNPKMQSQFPSREFSRRSKVFWNDGIFQKFFDVSENFHARKRRIEFSNSFLCANLLISTIPMVEVRNHVFSLLCPW